jgi:hypothetical protein
MFSAHDPTTPRAVDDPADENRALPRPGIGARVRRLAPVVGAAGVMAEIHGGARGPGPGSHPGGRGARRP